MPAADQPVGDTVRYHVRTGKHDITAYDWQQYLDFAERHFRMAPAAAPQPPAPNWSHDGRSLLFNQEAGVSDFAMTEDRRFSAPALRAAVSDALARDGVPLHVREVEADLMVEAELHGVPSHGL